MSDDASAKRPLSVAFVLPYGEPRQSFFPDAVLELCLAEARAAGHDAALVRVYYDGRDASADAAVRAELSEWLEERDADVVVAERLFDPAPIVEHVSASEHRAGAILSWGDAEPIDGIEWVVGLTPGTLRRGLTRRSPTGGELVAAVGGLLEALALGADPSVVPGLARFDGERVHPGAPAAARELPSPYRPALEHHLISAAEAPAIRRKFLLGNAGCPFAKDPSKVPFYEGAELPEGSLSRLGCAFCHAGGDYQKRPDARVVERVLEQAQYHVTHVPELEELVLIDQHPMRYLAPLLRAAAERGLPRLRWLFSARVDSFVRERDRIREAIAVAAQTGQRLEVFLSGFESFSAAELQRYNKGVGPDELLEAVDVMRELRAGSDGAFEYARARGHSLILWSPWTSPADLRASVSTVRERGLHEVFSELGRNRLRLYRDLPIFYAAQRDGALTDAWESGDAGAGRRKGYAVEHPWRFLEPRTREAYALALTLRDRLGPRTELGQLSAILDQIEGLEEGSSLDEAAALSGVDRLAGALLEIARARGRAPTLRARLVPFAGACDNRCRACAQGDSFAPDDRGSLERRIEAARASGMPLLFAGREPAVHPALLALLEAAAGDDARPVGLVTNARAFSDEGLSRAAMDAGLAAASVKLFAPGHAAADVATGVEGSHAQALRGIGALRAAGLSALELRCAVRRESVDRLPDFVDLAVDLGVPRLRLEVALDALGLDQLEAATQAIGALRRRAASSGVAVDASPLSAGTRGFDRLPVTR